MDLYIRTFHQLPPEQARDYYRESGERFEEFAASHFPQLLGERRVGDLALLSAVAYVRTREIRGYEVKLREILTTHRSGRLAETIHDTCLDALLATAEDRNALARFLAQVGTQRDPPPGRQRCVDGLRRLQPEAANEMLALLELTTDAGERRRLANLIQSVTRVSSPEPLRFWQQTTATNAIHAAVQTWRQQIAGTRTPATRDVP